MLPGIFTVSDERYVPCDLDTVFSDRGVVPSFLGKEIAFFRDF